MSNDFLNVEFFSDYGYFREGPNNDIETRILDYQGYFQSLDWTDDEIDIIREELVETGKIFARNQGFSEGPSVITLPNGKYRVNTGKLFNGIKAEPLPDYKSHRKIRFYNDAEHDGEYYAGHLEYGFHDRGGNFISARPFMRPALYAVAEGSKGNFSDIMKGLLGNIWLNKGFDGFSSLKFASRTAKPKSALWKSPHNLSNTLSKRALSKNGMMRRLQDDEHRNRLSLMNPTHPNSFSFKKGFNLKKNLSDFKKMGFTSVGKRMKKSSKRRTKKSKSKKSSKKQNKKKKSEKKQPEKIIKSKTLQGSSGRKQPRQLTTISKSKSSKKSKRSRKNQRPKYTPKSLNI